MKVFAKSSDLENAYPGWHVWEAVFGNSWYVRRLLSSPPVVFRSSTLTGLAQQIERHVNGAGRSGSP